VELFLSIGFHSLHVICYLGFGVLLRRMVKLLRSFDSHCSRRIQGNCEADGGSRVYKSRNGSECRIVEHNGARQGGAL
jgi:hypothetical protein